MIIYDTTGYQWNIFRLDHIPYAVSSGTEVSSRSAAVFRKQDLFVLDLWGPQCLKHHDIIPWLSRDILW